MGGETGGKVCGLRARAAAFLGWVIRFLKYTLSSTARLMISDTFP